MTHPVNQSLRDAASACQEIELFIRNVAFQKYLTERLLQLAIERLFTILGEALHRVRKVDRATAAEIPHANNVIGMRHAIVHGYGSINHKTVWEAATVHVPELRTVIESLIASE